MLALRGPLLCTGFGTTCSHASGLRSQHEAFCRGADRTSSAVAFPTCDGLPASATKGLRSWRGLGRRYRVAAPCFASSTLGQAGSGSELAGRLGRCLPECPRGPLRDRSNGASPKWRCFRQPDSERPHQATIAVTLLKEPLPEQRLSGNPVQQVGVYLWPDRFHEVAGETVAIRGVHVQNAKPRIKPKRSGCKAGFRFEHCI